MAKTRRPVKQKRTATTRKGAPARAKSPKRATGKKRPSTRPPSRKPVLELKKLRQELGQVLSVLSTRRAAAPEAEAQLDDTRRRISQWMADIDEICTPDLQEICGPDMAFPLPG